MRRIQQGPGHAVSGGRRSVPLDFTPKVVYAIALKSGEPVTPKTLFTFTQVAMYPAVRQLRAANIEVEIVTVSR